jgi:hypothetical protein
MAAKLNTDGKSPAFRERVGKFLVEPCLAFVVTVSPTQT